MKHYKIAYSDSRGSHEVEFGPRQKYALNYFMKIVRYPKRNVREVRLFELDLETEQETEMLYHQFVATVNGRE